MTPAMLSAGLDETGLSMRQFARLTGAREDRVQKWLEGKEDIPPFVYCVLTMATIPAALAKALAVIDKVCTNQHREGRNADQQPND
jgi:uncharacterized protein (DUF488 family)